LINARSKIDNNVKYKKASSTKYSKKHLRLMGKVVYDKENSKVGMTVWKKKTLKANNYRGKLTIYIKAKCELCKHDIIIDERGYKICSNCGYEIKHQEYYNNVPCENDNHYSSLETYEYEVRNKYHYDNEIRHKYHLINKWEEDNNVSRSNSTTSV